LVVYVLYAWLSIGKPPGESIPKLRLCKFTPPVSETNTSYPALPFTGSTVVFTVLPPVIPLPRITSDVCPPKIRK